jgi:imidazolonepropionase-like amidohydrolase
MTRRLASVVVVCLLYVGGPQDAAAQNLTISNARIIVGNGQVIEQGSVVVRDGRIAAVQTGAAGAQDSPAIDARGMTVMPGFIDAHRHVMGGNAEQWFREQSGTRMREFLEAGYTTLMSGGGPVPGIIQLKERIDRGELTGPRIITSGRVDPPSFPTADAARAEVRRLAQAGVEIIKARMDNVPSPAQNAVLSAITDEATRHDLDVMVHAVSPAAMVAAVKSGATKLVHTPHFGWLTEADAQVVRDAGVEVLSCIGFGVPVFGVHNDDNVPTFRDGNPWPGGILDGVGRGREAGEKAVNARTLWDAGVTYGFGTDTGYHPLAGLAHELRALNLMFSPEDLITLLGPNTAAFIEKSDELGTLEPGKLADIVVLDGNPLEGYWNLLRATIVIKGGEVVVDKR